jgi:LacI family transcriptional regulator
MRLGKGLVLATIKDVAREAGLAISTVSAVINRSAPVSGDAIERVQDAIRRTGYVPHGGARSLRSGRSNLIGLVLPNIANPHFAAVAREVENICLAKGLTTVVFSTGQDALRESRVLTMMRLQRVAGLIVIPTRSDAQHGAALVDQIHVPTVLLDMQVEGLPFDVVKTDNVEAGRLATEHLIGLGHRRIGMVVGIPGLATSDDRHAGYLAAHRQAGIPVDAQLVVPGMFDQAASHDAVESLLNLLDPPTAVVTVSNMALMGALFALRERKTVVPQDLSIVGIDDLEFSAILNPRPTVVVTPILDMARRAIEMLLHEIATGAKPAGKWEVWRPRLLVRESSASPRP